MSDTWISNLAKSIRNYLPWPHFFKCTPALRHKPLDTDDEVEFYSDMRYLDALLDAILDDCRLAKREVGGDVFADFVGRPLLQAVSIPVESVKFWQEWEWPVDYAASLLSLWRFDREMETWMEQTEEAA